MQARQGAAIRKGIRYFPFTFWNLRHERRTMTNKDKLQELLEARAQAQQELEKMRTPVTILFSDIKGSTTYFEKKGDVEGMAMINRHNSILFPVIEGEGGRVVKTIGDAIMA